MTTKRPPKKAPAKAGAIEPTESVQPSLEDADDPVFEKGLALAGPAVVEVQSPDRRIAEFLKKSDSFHRILDELSQRHGDRKSREAIEWFLLWFVPVSLDPPLEDFLSKSERSRIAKEVSGSIAGLKSALKKIEQENGCFAFPFQPLLSRFAVHAAASDYVRWHEYEHGDEEELVHRTRFAIYHAVTEGLVELLDHIDQAAEMFAEHPAKVSRPNKANAKRLYFIRNMTFQMQRELGSPNRKAVLELASLFFDCSDLDEAAVSKLAPVVRPKPVVIPGCSEDEG